MLFTATTIATILFSRSRELQKQDQLQLHLFVIGVVIISIYVVASLISQKNRVECSKKHQQQDVFCQCYRYCLSTTSNSQWCALICQLSTLAVQIDLEAIFQNNYFREQTVFYSGRTAFKMLCAPFATNINFSIRLDLDNVIYLTNSIVYYFHSMTQYKHEISFYIPFYHILTLSLSKVFYDWLFLFILVILYMYLVLSFFVNIVTFISYTRVTAWNVIYFIHSLIDECTFNNYS